MVEGDQARDEVVRHRVSLDTPRTVLPPLMTLWMFSANSGTWIPTSASVPSGASASIADVMTEPCGGGVEWRAGSAP